MALHLFCGTQTEAQEREEEVSGAKFWKLTKDLSGQL